MTPDEEYNSKQKGIKETIRFCQFLLAVGGGLLAYHFFIDNNYKTLIALFIILFLDVIALYGASRDELEKVSSYMDSLKTREQYLSGELKRYHTYIEKKEKRKFVNL